MEIETPKLCKTAYKIWINKYPCYFTHNINRKYVKIQT